MKLLKKQEVNTQSAEIRRQQVVEGQDLVKRIEALRVALSSLQEQHRNFLDKSKEELKRDTTELYSQRETLKSEVESLAAVKEELQKPLDEEWRRIKQESTILATNQERFLLDQLNFSRKENELDVEKMRLDQRADKLQVRENEINEREKVSVKISEESQDTITGVRKGKQTIEAQLAKRLKEIARKEKVVDAELQEATRIKKASLLREMELDEREDGLNEKRETLLRIEKAINKK